ncbi:MAG: hypothetical protein QF578_14415 [Alphaproteobacteria bacterium]|nr:hypothetical protein [Alphaproteobacteria bacterium]MDP6566016.1 hypothetical protein [Alphaproteobacteria bacterium]MDP6812269.1 hypothetical protein [Alphaproteobacteria bacterium]
MLDRNRQRLDALYGGSGRPAPMANPAPAPPAVPPPAAAPERSPVSARLDARYGEEWRFEVAERRRDGDEVIVLGKLFVGQGEEAVAKSQFGRARIGAPSGGRVSGSSDGVAFSFGAGGAAPGGGDSEEAAYRQAADAALAQCAEML